MPSSVMVFIELGSESIKYVEQDNNLSDHALTIPREYRQCLPIIHIST